MSGEVLGEAILVLGTDMAPMLRGLTAAERATVLSGARMQATMDKRMLSMGHSMGKVGSTMSRNFTLPIVAAGLEAVKMGANFQAAMERVHTQAGARQKDIKGLSDQVLELAKHSAQGPQALADGLFHLKSIGIPTAKVMGDLATASKLAAVGGANLEATASALGAAWVVNIKGAGDFNHVAGILNATVGAGNVKMEALVESLGTGLLPAAKNAGLSIQDAMAALAVFTDEGYQASSAAAQLSTAFHFLSNPTAKADKALQGMGLSSTSLAADMHKPNGLLVALRDLKDHLDKLPGGASGVKAEQTLGNILPGGRGRILLTLLNQLDRYSQKIGQIKSNTDQFSKDVAQTQQTTAYKIHVEWSKIQADAIKLGEALGPTFLKIGSGIADEATKIADAFSKLPPGMQQAIIDGGLLLAGIGPAMKLMGVFTGGVGRLLQAAVIADRLAKTGSLKQGAAGALGSTARLASMQVATMQVGELIAKGFVGGGVGGAGVKQPVLAPGETRSPGGVILPPGTAGAAAGATVAEEKAAQSMMTKLGLGLSMALGRAMRGGMITLGGVLASQLAKQLIGGKAGKTVGGFGTSAAIGAGVGSFLGPAGTLGGAVGGALGHELVSVLGIGKPADDAAVKYALRFGHQMADHIEAGLPRALDKSTKESLAKSLAQAKLYGEQADAAFKKMRQDNPFAGIGAPSGQTLTNLINAQGFRLDQTMQNRKAGTQAAQAWITGYQSVRFKNEGTFVASLEASFSGYPKDAQNSGALSALKFAEGLEQNGKLPSGSVKRMIKDLEGQFPGLQSYLKSAGLSSSQDFADNFKFDKVRKNLQSTVNAIQHNYGLMVGDTKVTGDNMAETFNKATKALKQAAKNNTGQARDVALKQLGQLRDQADQYFTTMASQTTSQMRKLSSTVKSNAADAQSSAAISFNRLAGNIANAVSAGTIAAAKGTMLIAQALNQELKAFGEKPIPLADLKGQSASELIGLSNLNLQGATGPGRAGAAARGGLFQIGRPGEAGRDTVPLNVGGTPIVVGRGEQVAVFNRHQLPVLNARLSDMGGLPGFFQKHTRPNYLASGGLVGQTGGTTTNDAQLKRARAAQKTGDIHAPTVQGGGTVANIAQAALGLAAKAANAYERAHMPKVSGGTAPGTVLAQGAGPMAVQGAMMAAANHIIGLPYGHTGGHGVWEASNYDCSGSVGYILHAAGLQPNFGWTGTDVSWGLPGPGKYITRGIRNANSQAQGHEMMSFFGKFIESGGGGPFGRGSVHWDPGWDGAFDTYRHPAGFARGGLVDPLARMLRAFATGGLAYSVNASAEVDGGTGAFGFSPGGVGYSSLSASGTAHDPNTAGAALGYPHPPNPLYIRLANKIITATLQDIGSGSDGILPTIGIYPAARSQLGMGGGSARVDIERTDGAAFTALRGTPIAAFGALAGKSGGKVGTAGATAPTTKASAQQKVIAAKLKAKKIVNSRMGRVKLPHLPSVGQFNMDIFTGLDDEIAGYERALRYLVDLHGNPPPFESTLDVLVPAGTKLSDGTISDGTSTQTVVNPGIPGKNYPSGLLDQTASPPTVTKSIRDRLFEIGAVGTRDPYTELGLSNLIIDTDLKEQARALSALNDPKTGLHAYIAAQFAAGQISDKEVAWLAQSIDLSQPLPKLMQDFNTLGSVVVGVKKTKLGKVAEGWGNVGFGGQTTTDMPISLPWAQEIMDKVREYRNQVSLIKHWETLKHKIPADRKTRDDAITKQVEQQRLAIQNASSKSTYTRSGLLSDQIAALEKEKSGELHGLSSKEPSYWKGDHATWLAQLAKDRQAIEDEYKQREDALRKQAGQKGLSAKLSKAQALVAVTDRERDDKSSVGSYFSSLSTDYQNAIDFDRTTQGNDKKWLTGLKTAVKAQGSTAKSNWRNGNSDIKTLEDYNAPNSDFVIGMLESLNVIGSGGVAYYLDQIGQLKGLLGGPQVISPAANGGGGSTDGSGGSGDTGAGTSADQSALLALLQQQLATLGTQFAVSQAQYPVLAGALSGPAALPGLGGQLPPWGGSFYHGGVVPGVMGEPRLIVAHGGEEYAGVGNHIDSGDIHVTHNYAPGMEWLAKFVTTTVEKRERTSATRAGRRLPSQGGGKLFTR